MTDPRLLPLVVDAAANDYENLQMITEQVLGWAGEKSIPVTPAQILAVLSEAVSQGYLQAFMYSEAKQTFEPSEYSPEQTEKLYFYATKKGRATLA